MNKKMKIFFIMAFMTGISLIILSGSKTSVTSFKSKEPEALKIKKDTIFTPDTSINEQIFLNNPLSIVKTYGNIMSIMDQDADLPNMYIINSTKKQYLKLILHPGNIANFISQFEVGYSINMAVGVRKKPSINAAFASESKIQLGISKAEIIKIKGYNYKEVVKNKIKFIRYRIDDFKNSSFLKRYNTPVYLAEYWLKNDKLIRFRFGFECP